MMWHVIPRKMMVNINEHCTITYQYLPCVTRICFAEFDKTIELSYSSEDEVVTLAFPEELKVTDSLPCHQSLHCVVCINLSSYKTVILNN